MAGLVRLVAGGVGEVSAVYCPSPPAWAAGPDQLPDLQTFTLSLSLSQSSESQVSGQHSTAQHRPAPPVESPGGTESHSSHHHDHHHQPLPRTATFFSQSGTDQS